MRVSGIFAALALCVFLGGSGRTGEAPAVAGFLAPDASGAFRIGELGFALGHWDDTWRPASQGAATLTPDDGFPRQAADAFALRGTWTVGGGGFALEQDIAAAGDGRADYSVRLAAGKAVKTRELALVFHLPAKQYLDRAIRVDGKPVGFGKTLDETRWMLDFPGVKSLKIVMAGGELELTGDFDFRLQDDRKFNLDHWDARVRLAPANGDIARAQLALTLAFRPFAQTLLDLRAAATMAFADEVAGDRRGGWTDQGSENDLRALPPGRQTFAGVRFDIIDPAKNGGKSCIALRGKERPYFPEHAEATLPEPAGGKYLYVLNAVGWEPNAPKEVGEITVEYADDRWAEKPVKTFAVASGVDVGNFWMPRTIKNAAIGWRDENPSSTIGLYVSRFELGGARIRKISFDASGDVVWMIVGATLSDQPIDIKQDEPVVMGATDEWLRYHHKRGIVKNSILDFSDLLDAPAGKHGFVQVADGHFGFARRPGRPVRFHGANIAFDVNFMAPALVDRMADDFAALGYNLVRFHHFDRDLAGPDSTTLRPDKIERMDYMLAAFKRRGIYATIDLYMLREIPKGVLPSFPDRAIGADEYKALAFLHDPVMENLKTFSANLLNHVNPHTGLAWKDDPAIATISIINEDTLFSTVDRSPWVRGFYEKNFAEWLAHTAPDAPPEHRDSLWRRFLGEIHARGYARLEAFLRELGVKVPVTDQNHWSTNSVTVLREALDFVDNHFYWAHPQFLGPSWGLPAAVNADSAISRHAGGLSQLFPTRIFGKPFAVSEWGHVNPNPHNVEGAFLTGAYASLQDWDLLCRFAYSHTPTSIEYTESPIGFFDNANDPMLRLADRAAALAFLRRDVKPAATSYPFLLARDHLKNPRANDVPPGLVQRLGLVGKTGTLPADPGAVSKWPENTRAVIAREKTWTRPDPATPLLDAPDTAGGLAELLKAGALDPKRIDPAEGRFVSDTGELELHSRNGTFKMVTARSEAFILGGGQSLSGAFATVANEATFAAFLVAARDDLPLAQSTRILLLHLTDTKNTGMKFRDGDGQILESWGGLPLLARKGAAEVTLSAPLDGYRLFAVDVDGGRRTEVPMTRRDGRCHFRLDMVYGEDICFAYELIKEP